MDSPTRSQKNGYDTRFSTPVSELDDHRLQEPIPAVDQEIVQQRRASNIQAPSAAHAVQAVGADLPTRRLTSASARQPIPTLLTPPSHGQVDLPIARDFENALTDDEAYEPKSPRSPLAVPRPHRSRHSTRGAQDMERLDVDDDDMNIAVTSRSSSPPNSVDAFAEPRRRERAYTAESRAPPVAIEFSLARTTSGGTNRRRPTLTNGNVSVRDLPNDAQNPPEDDVCFPVDVETTNSFIVDFEAIEEFVAESRLKEENNLLNRRHSFTSSGLNYPGRAYQPPGTDDVPAATASSASRFPWTKTDSVELFGTSSNEFDEKHVEIHEARKPSVAEDQRFSFFSSEIEQTIHASSIGDLVMPGETFRDLFELPMDGGAWWLDVMNPTEAEMDMIQKAFGIHRLTIEDIEKQEAREKVELFRQYYFVSFRTFVMDKARDDYLEPIMKYMIVSRDGILTFSYAHNPHASHVRRRIGKLRNYINLTSDWICYALVDDIVDCFAPPIGEIELEADQIEDQVFTLRPEDAVNLLRKIGDCRKRVTSLMRLLGGKADVIRGFSKRCNEHYAVAPRSDIGLYLGDIQDHVVTMMSNLTANDKMLSRSHANYLAHLQVDHLTQGNKANDVLSKITVAASILVPMNIITGLFGMNVTVPGEDTGSLNWFMGILAFILFCVICGLGYAKKKKYL